MSKYALYSKLDIFLGDDIMYTDTDATDFLDDETTSLDSYTELAYAKLKLLKLDIDAWLRYSRKNPRVRGDLKQNYDTALSIINTKATLQFWCDIAQIDHDAAKEWLLTNVRK